MGRIVSDAEYRLRVLTITTDQKPLTRKRTGRL